MMPITARMIMTGANSRAAFGKECEIETQESVRSHFQQHTGKNYRTGGRRFCVRVGQPGVKREERNFDTECERKSEKQPKLGARRKRARRHRLKNRHVVKRNDR